MKKDELDLRALENADDETVKRLSESYSAVTEKEMERLFDRAESMYRGEKITVSSRNEVSGVDVYRRPVWHRFLAAASAVLLIAGVCTGGGMLLKSMKNEPYHADTEMTEVTMEEAALSAAPFSDISGGRVRFMTPAYAPYVYDTFSDKTAQELAEAFNNAEWEQLPEDSQMPDGERTFVYVDNNGQRFSLAFCGGTVSYEKDGSITNYSVSEEVSGLVHRLASPTEPADALQGHLIWCKTEDLNADGVWKNNEPVPEKIFEAAVVPPSLEGKNIIDNYPLYEYAYDIHDINENAGHADDLIVGKVEEVSYGATVWAQENGPSNGTPFTTITVTVTGDTAGRYAPGDTVDITTAGGFISLRDLMGDKLYPKDGTLVMTEEEIDNTYYHEIVESGEVPIIGKEYAFFVADDTSGGISSVGFEYGMLYKCDNLYIQRNEQGFNFYDMNELRAMMGLPPEAEENSAAADESGDEWGISMSLGKVTPKSAELTITRTGAGNPKGTLETGRDFRIEQLTDGVWEKLEPNMNAAFTSEAINIPEPGSDPLVMSLGWEYLYNELPPGQYRLVKEVTDYTGPGNSERKEYCIPFEVGASADDTGTDNAAGENKDRFGISMEMSEVTSKQARLTIKHDSTEAAGKLKTDSQYWIEKETPAGWQRLEMTGKVVFPDDMYDIPADGRLDFVIAWYWTFGELEPGRYRLEKTVKVMGNDGSIDGEKYYVPFEVPESSDAVNLPYYDIPGTTEQVIVTLPVIKEKGKARMISAVGDNGKSGYIYEQDMLDDGVRDPAEAQAKMEAIKNGTYEARKINVYAEDGVTVIDTLTEQLP